MKRKLSEERLHLYDPYGRVTFLKPDWSPQEVTGHDDGTASAFGNEILFTGYRYNPETGTYQARNREYHPTLGRFMQRDPLGYVDGGNLYAGYFVMWGEIDLTRSLGWINFEKCGCHQSISRQKKAWFVGE